jgi:hypothetical protein
MKSEPCWAIAADGLRCEAPSVFGDYFCIVHGLGSRPEPDQIWRAPVCEMPPGLVVLIRAEDPDAVFPGSETEPLPSDVDEAPALPISDWPAALPDPAPLAVSPPEAEAWGRETGPAGQPAEVTGAAADPDPASFSWLQAALRAAIEDMMADEAAAPLQKANAVSRLGNLYLKTHGAAERVKENRALNRRIEELEAQLVTAVGQVARLEAMVVALLEAAAGQAPAGAPADPGSAASPSSPDAMVFHVEREAILQQLRGITDGQPDPSSGRHDPP